MGLVRVSVLGGRNIRSAELGLAGNVGCRVYWDPTRFMTDKQKKKAIDIDESASATHDVGATNFVYAMNPRWDGLHESEGAKRLNLLMPNQGTFFENSSQPDEKKVIDFPVLQPIGISGDLQVLESWDTSSAALVVEVQFFDLLNVIPGTEYSIGEVIIPFRELINKGEVSGWCNITGTVPAVPSLTSEDEGKHTSDIARTDIPQLLLSVSWVPPDPTRKSTHDTEREASYAIQEEMVRSALLTRQQKEKFSLLGSSIEALNTVRGISANLMLVQNSLGSILDLCESCIHGLDFSVRSHNLT